MLALVVFLAVAAIVSALRRRSRRARGRRRRRARGRGRRLSRALAGDADPLPTLLDALRAAFGLDGVAAVAATAPRRRLAIEAPSRAAALRESPEAPTATIDLDDEHVLVLRRQPISRRGPPRARRLRRGARGVRSTLGELEAGGSSRRRARRGERAAHRAPRRGVARPPHAARVDQGVGDEPARRTTSTGRRGADASSCDTIDEETDRLNALVGNLLDMSRLQTGALERQHATGRARGGRSRRARAASATRRPRRRARRARDAAAGRRRSRPARARARERRRQRDPAGRPSGRRSRVTAGAVGGCVDLRVIDRGPGIPPRRRERGVPAVPAARRPRSRRRRRPRPRGRAGFVEAMGGELEVEDTPGGGTDDGR